MYSACAAPAATLTRSPTCSFPMPMRGARHFPRATRSTPRSIRSVRRCCYSSGFCSVTWRSRGGCSTPIIELARAGTAGASAQSMATNNAVQREVGIPLEARLSAARLSPRGRRPGLCGVGRRHARHRPADVRLRLATTHRHERGDGCVACLLSASERGGSCELGAVRGAVCAMRSAPVSTSRRCCPWSRWSGGI